MEMRIRNSWMASAFSSGVSETNGPYPLTAFQIVRKTTSTSARFIPFGPKRTAAQSRIGTGVYRRVFEGVKFQLKAIRLTEDSERARATVSIQRPIDKDRNTVSRSDPHMTMNGTTMISARTFEKNRVRHKSQ